ncbi:TPA: methylase, partial [Enterococcus faecium]|nr:methylase [Enterococcus faecium]
FSFLDEPIDKKEEVVKEMQYIPVKIIDVYKEEMEEANG